MAHPRLAALLALALLAPFSLATSTTTDPAFDERVTFGPLTPPADACDAPAADVLSTHVRIEGDDLVATVRLRDLAAPLVCGPRSMGPALGLSSTLRLRAGLDGPAATFQVSLSPLASARGCAEIHLPKGNGSAFRCAHGTWDSIVEGNGWTLRIPAQGTASGPFTNQTYDMTGRTYDVIAEAHASYGVMAFGTHVAPAQAHDTVDITSVTL